ncbi:MAG: hypothetical protein IJ094_09220 [Bacilli bacterium]|nr:hypothetical protein [Bacilli bacterium]
MKNKTMFNAKKLTEKVRASIKDNKKDYDVVITYIDKDNKLRKAKVKVKR